MADDLLTIR